MIEYKLATGMVGARVQPVDLFGGEVFPLDRVLGEDAATTLPQIIQDWPRQERDIAATVVGLKGKKGIVPRLTPAEVGSAMTPPQFISLETGSSFQ